MAVTDSAPATELKPYIETDRMEILRVVIVGVLAGFLTPLLSLMISNWLISPIFCQPNSGFSICSSGGVVAYHAAAIAIAIGVVVLFANWGVYRPLPLVLAVTVAMWGFKKFVEPLSNGSLVEYVLFSVLLTTFCYLLFFWLLRLRNFPASIILTIAAAALVCWALVA